MVKRTVVWAALAALAVGPARAESPQQEELQVALTCKTPSFKARDPILALNGTCGLPDGIMVKIALSSLNEMFVEGQIRAVAQSCGGGTAEVIGKKFGYDLGIDAPGKYHAEVLLIEDLQTKKLVAEIKKRAGNRRSWQFEFLVWGDELIGQLAPKLAELTQAVQEARELAKKFERACSSKQAWEAEKKELSAEGTKFMLRMDRLDVRTFFPASSANLAFAIRTFVANAPYYTFGPDGKFTGAHDYHADDKKVMTHRGEDFNWENLKRYVEETLSIAGREFGLWVVKDLRRTAGTMRGEVAEALKKMKTHAGLDIYYERLSKATITDLDALETELRGKPDPTPKNAPKSAKEGEPKKEGELPKEPEKKQ